MYESGEPQDADDPLVDVRPALDRLLAGGGPDQPEEAGGVEAAMEILFTATANHLVRQGTFTPQQVRDLMTALERHGAGR